LIIDFNILVDHSTLNKIAEHLSRRVVNRRLVVWPMQCEIEMLFAHLKRILRLDRLRLRGPSGAQDEFLLAATVQNLRKLAKLIPLPAPMPA
jgi:DDE family transposase